MNINIVIRELLRFFLPKRIHKQLRKYRKIFLSYFHKSKIKFKYDGNVELKLLKKSFRSYVLQNDAVSHEIIKRKIVNYILKNNYIYDKNIIDAGCHCGDSSLPWALNLKKTKTKIFCIDPSVENINFINKISELNKLNNIFTHQYALSDRNNRKYQAQGDSDELFMVELKESFKTNKFSNELIFSKTLDFLSAEFKFGKVGLLHIDAENLDYNILKGSSNLIRDSRPIIVCEVFLKSLNMKKICNFLKKYEYKLLIINEKCGSVNNCRNLLAVPSKIKFQNFLYNIKINLKTKNLETFKINQSHDFLEKI